MEHKVIHSDNGEVHYWIQRNRDTATKCIILTHGVTADHTMFEKQVDYFMPRYTVITWDIPLHGLSRPYRNFTYYNTAIELNKHFGYRGY